MKEQTIEQLTVARKELDGVLKCIDILRNRIDIRKEEIGRELSIAYTNVEEGRMWLGEIKHEIGEEYPYQGTNDATKFSDIKKAVDKAEEDIYSNYEYDNYIQSLGTLRKTIDNILDITFKIVDKYIRESSISTNTLTPYSINYILGKSKIKSGRMYLGVAMGKIRDNGYSRQ